MAEQHNGHISDGNATTGTTVNPGFSGSPREQHASPTQQIIFANTESENAAYGLDEEFDISTNRLLVWDDLGGVQDFIWNPDGTKAYILNLSEIKEYETDTPFDLVGLTQINTVDVSSDLGQAHGLLWNNDGDKLYIADRGNDDVVEFTAPTAFSISNISVLSRLSVSGDVDADGIAWDNSGSLLFVFGQISGSPGSRISTYSLGTQYDISTAAKLREFQVSGDVLIPEDVTWSNDGAHLLHTASSQTDTPVIHLTADEPFDTDTLTQEDQAEFIPINDSATPINSAWLKNPAEYAASTSRTGPLPTADSLSVSSEDGSPAGLDFDDVGDNAYMCGVGSNSVHQYGLTTSWDLSTGSLTQSTDIDLLVPLSNPNTNGIAFNDDGSKLFVNSQGGNFGTWRVYEFTTGSNYDISNLTLQNTFETTDVLNRPRDMKFNDTGTQLFIAGPNNDAILELQLASAYDLTNVTVGDSISLSGAKGIVFINSGDEMHTLDGSRPTLFKMWDLSTAYDITTATLSETYDLRGSLMSLEYNLPDDLFILSSSGENIRKYIPP